MNDSSLRHGASEMGSQTPRADTSALRIGVMGYYGFGNVGDEVILENIRQLFSPQTVVPFQSGFPGTEANIERLNAYDFLVLGGGGLYNQAPASPFDTFDQWQHFLRAPIGVLGLGVERLNTHYLSATCQFVDRTEFFIVRDAESKRLIDHPKVEVKPDLTFYRPFPVCDYPPGNSRILAGINLRPVRNEMVSWVDAIGALPCNKKAVPFSVVPTFDDREPLRLIDPACPDVFQPDIYRSLDIVIGTAFHSIVFAIQSGIPAIAISYHPKVRRIMEEVGLTDYVLRPDQADDLLPCYERLLADRDQVRETMQAYRMQAQEQWEQRAEQIRQVVDLSANVTHNERFANHERPRVSILVHASVKAQDEEVVRTVASCCTQSYPNTEILFLDEAESRNASLPNVCNLMQMTPDLRAPNKSDWVLAGLDNATGSLVVWIEAGSWYAPDAVEALVNVLEKHAFSAGVLADYYLTHEGVIERKITTSVGSAFERLSALSLCAMIAKDEAVQFRELQCGFGSETAVSGLADRLIHVDHGFLFKPYVEHEFQLYRSTIMYGQERAEEAGRLLEASLVGAASVPFRDDATFRAFLDAAFHPLITNDPVDYLVYVSDNLPSESVEARHFIKTFSARAFVEASYISHARGQTSKARRLLLRAFAADRRWLRHRGTLAFLFQTLLGEHVLITYRRAKGVHRIERKRSAEGV